MQSLRSSTPHSIQNQAPETYMGFMTLAYEEKTNFLKSMLMNFIVICPEDIGVAVLESCQWSSKEKHKFLGITVHPVGEVGRHLLKREKLDTFLLPCLSI